MKFCRNSAVMRTVFIIIIIIINFNFRQRGLKNKTDRQTDRTMTEKMLLTVVVGVVVSCGWAESIYTTGPRDG